MTDQAPKKPSRLPLVLTIIVLAILVAGGAFFFLTQGGGQAASPAQTPAPELGPDTAKATPHDAGATAVATSDPTATPASAGDPTVSTASAPPQTAPANPGPASRIDFANQSLKFKAEFPGPASD